eukprot:14577760-Alexandrium_andersonii.AAC.1
MSRAASLPVSSGPTDSSGGLGGEPSPAPVSESGAHQSRYGTPRSSASACGESAADRSHPGPLEDLVQLGLALAEPAMDVPTRQDAAATPPDDHLAELNRLLDPSIP